jgi:hypothetical protein
MSNEYSKEELLEIRESNMYFIEYISKIVLKTSKIEENKVKKINFLSILKLTFRKRKIVLNI